MQFINQVSDMRGDTGEGEEKSGTRCADQRGSGREVTRIQNEKRKRSKMTQAMRGEDGKSQSEEKTRS